MANQPKNTINRFWMVVIGLLIVVGILFFYNGMTVNETAQVGPDSRAPSTEWTTAPETGVAVDLPQTPMQGVPTDQASDGASAAAPSSDEAREPTEE